MVLFFVEKGKTTILQKNRGIYNINHNKFDNINFKTFNACDHRSFPISA